MPNDKTDLSVSADTELLLQKMLDILRGLRFGSIEITVHDGRIVQMERREKYRFSLPGSGHGDSRPG